MKGIWIRSQDECKVVFTKSVEAWSDEAWSDGRLVARFGKDFSILGTFESQDDARMVVGRICKFVQNRNDESATQVFNVPFASTVKSNFNNKERIDNGQ